jgi:acetyl-CoA acyltransferase 1
VVAKAGVDPAIVGDIHVGNVLAPGGFASQARMAMFLAGFPDSVPVSTVNRQCSSGLQAFANVASNIRAGFYDVGIAAGVESMSTADMMGSVGDINEKVFDNELAAACLNTMGVTSENVAEKFGVTRAMQDSMALASNQRAISNRAALDSEIIPVTTTVIDRKSGEEKTITVTSDDGPRQTTIEKLGKLRAAFKENGTTTAGNSSQVSDGAAAVLLMTRSRAQQLGLPVMGRFISYSVVGVRPEIMGIGPAVAIPDALAKAGLRTQDVDVFEINEAFASQATYCCNKLGLDMSKVNPLGGAIALGHPLGCTGARQIVTLFNQLNRTNGKYGVVSMCIGTGMGAAGVFERE